jgi:hypothetical protein
MVAPKSENLMPSGEECEAQQNIWDLAHDRRKLGHSSCQLRLPKSRRGENPPAWRCRWSPHAEQLHPSSLRLGGGASRGTVWLDDVKLLKTPLPRDY